MRKLAETNISLVNSVFIKQMVFPQAGDWAVTHAHVYDHQTLLSAGSLAVTMGVEEARYDAPAIIVIRAGVHHSLTALVDGTVAYCIHAVMDGPTVEEAAPLVQGCANADLVVPM